MREILFRRSYFSPTGEFSHFSYWGPNLGHAAFTSPGSCNWADVKADDQLSGIQDKRGERIFEGDILKIRRPIRSTQVHVGDNIPLGRYEEPLEPKIEEEIYVVKFENGCFVVDSENGLLLCWTPIEYDRMSAIEEFAGRWPPISWEGEDGDLAYLLQEYNFQTEEELIKSLGTEVIGNIYENPELLPQ